MDIVKYISNYNDLKLDEVIDHERFNHYAIVHHSSSIEGSTLDDIETRVLLEEGITPKGKPLEHSLMVEDHYHALLFTLAEAEKSTSVSIELIQAINSKVMKRTGSVVNSALGSVDVARGEFRKGNVHAGSSYFINYDKVPKYTQQLANSLRDKMSQTLSVKEQVELSFSAHFDLVTIHPFYDGNGRTSRLLMNFVQRFFKLPLAIVFKEDKTDYYKALQQSREKEDISVFYDFMTDQYRKHLDKEISEYKKLLNGQTLKPRTTKGKGFSLFF